MVGMSISNRLVLPTSVKDFDKLGIKFVFVTVRKGYLDFPEEPKHPLVLVIAYCGYLVQAESLTVRV